MLPSVLLGDGQEGRPVRRSTRDWFVDALMFVLACTAALLTAPDLDGQPDAVILTEQVMGALSCAAIWLRRRWPVTLAIVTALLSSVLSLVGGAAGVALFTVAVHRPFKISGPILALNLLTVMPLVFWRPDPELGVGGTFVLTVSLATLVFGWGVLIRARRQLVWSLRLRADGAADEARRLERERIAREMHDVLAHRISILSLHAGALEFRPDASPEEIAKAAGAIRGSAHQALQDLREVIGVLRGPGDDPVPERPQPTLADLPVLAEESRQAGMAVRLSLAVQDVPESLGRNAYRIVQEALTNARKHAPGAAVTVSVTGAPGDGLTIEVSNRVTGRVHHGIPGAGAGLIGLTERAELLGGRLRHGREQDHFVLEAWLPWAP